MFLFVVQADNKTTTVSVMLLELSWNELSYVHFSKYVTFANHVLFINTPVFINTCVPVIHTRNNTME